VLSGAQSRHHGQPGHTRIVNEKQRTFDGMPFHLIPLFVREFAGFIEQSGTDALPISYQPFMAGWRSAACR
jgi:hypothetical protein